MEQRVLQFEYQQSLVQESERPGWSESITVSIRLLSEAITSGWYRQQFAHRGNDFVILLAIALHARPLKGNDLQMLVNLHMATQADEGRLYARVSDAALAGELGMSRMTIARSTLRLARDRSIHVVEIPEKLIAFRDSHGRFNGRKVYLVAGDIQARFLEKNIEKVDRAVKSSTVRASHATNQSIPVTDPRINEVKDDENEEVENAFILKVFSYYARKKGDPDYHPTIKEQVALERLIGDGFSFEQIVAGIDIAFIRPSRPRYFTLCAAIARDLVRFQQETREPGNSQSVIPQPDALIRAPQSEYGEVIETDLAKALEVYRSSGREITGDVLARFHLMVKHCDQAACKAGSSGGEWLAEALSRALGVAQPQNLLNYATAVLKDWVAKRGEEGPVGEVKRPDTSRHRAFPKTREPAAHAGIREYLKTHGGVQDGEPN